MKGMGEIADLERRLREFISKVSSDFGVSAPTIELHSPEELEMYFTGGSEVAGWYSSDEEKIILNSEFADLETVLHEYAHHLQFLRSGRDLGKAFPFYESTKPHCERGFEREAKGFALAYREFYYNTWRKITGRER